MTRALRRAVGFPPFAALWLVGFLIEAADDVLTAIHPHARHAALRLRAWMEVR